MTRIRRPSHRTLVVILSLALVYAAAALWQVGGQWREESRFWKEELRITRDSELRFLRENEDIHRRLSEAEVRMRSLEGENGRLKREVESMANAERSVR